jgi:small basic protein (TIGR04137 family)
MTEKAMEAAPGRTMTLTGPRLSAMMRARKSKVQGSWSRIMSQHASLKSAQKIATKRNVLKRFERIDLLRKRGKWKEGNRGVGLPKTKPEP